MGGADLTPELSVSNLVVEHNEVFSSRTGIYLSTSYGAFGAQDLSNITISDNNLHDLHEIGIRVHSPVGNTEDPPEVRAVLIQNNSISMLLPKHDNGPLPVGLYLHNATTTGPGTGGTVFSAIKIVNNAIDYLDERASFPVAALPSWSVAAVLAYGVSNFEFHDNDVVLPETTRTSNAIQVWHASEFVIDNNRLSWAGGEALYIANSKAFSVSENDLLGWNANEMGAPAARLEYVSDISFIANTLETATIPNGPLIKAIPASPTGTFIGNIYVSDNSAELTDMLTNNLVLVGLANVNGTGNDRANTIIGNVGANLLSGKGGDDVLIGGSGNDTMSEGAGDDRFYIDQALDRALEAVGGGTDQVYAAVSYALEVGSEIEILSTDDGNGTSTINLTGNEFGQSILGNAGTNFLNGAGGNDAMSGGAGADILIGGSGNDTMSGGAGDDRFYIDQALDRALEAVGGGTDQVYAAASYALEVGSEIEILSTDDGNGTSTINLTGNEFGQSILGNAGTNFLNGAGGNDAMSGGAGADILIGGSGNDTMSGGAGDDRFYIDQALDRAIEAVGGGTDQVYATVSYALEVGSEIEILSTDDGNGTSTINLTGNEFGQSILGNAGSNFLNGAGGNDAMSGGAGGDILIGGSGNDTMSGGAGDDVFYVDNLFDRAMDGVGSGFDRVYATASYALEVGSEIEILSTDDGNGTSTINLTGNEFGQSILGNAGSNFLNGAGGNDAMSGGAGGDILIGGSGNDTMSGGAGDDRFYIDQALDRAIEAVGGETDQVYATASYALEVGSEIEVLSTDDGNGTSTINLTGNEFGQSILGNAGTNFLNGAGGDDAMSGGAGDDILIGGFGNDTMSGGTGDDVFKFYIGSAAGDLVQDFNGNGIAPGNSIQFVGYGSGAGAHLVQLDATHWQINSSDGVTAEVFTIVNGANLTYEDDIFI